MTKSILRLNVFFVIGTFATLLAIAIFTKNIKEPYNFYKIISDFSSLFVAIGAAYLAYCFQRRQAFILSLKDLWKEMIEAKGEIIEYTHNEKPDQAAFGKAHRALSKCIDLVRGVYRNVGETNAKVGFFPFEPLHDMRRALETLGWENSSCERRQTARGQVIQSWNALRCNFLKEFSTPEPGDPITHRGAMDPRR